MTTTDPPPEPERGPGTPPAAGQTLDDLFSPAPASPEHPDQETPA